MQLYLIKTDVENSNTYIYDTKKETLTNTAPVKMKVVSLSKELFNQAMKEGRYAIVKKVYTKENIKGKELLTKKENMYQDGPLSWTTEWKKGQRLKIVACEDASILYKSKCWTFEDSLPFRTLYSGLDKNFFIVNKVSKTKGTKRPSENWVNKISEAKYLRCIKGKDVVRFSEEKYYDTLYDISYEAKRGSFYATHVNKCPCPAVKSYRLKTINYKIGNWLLGESEDVVEDFRLENKSNEHIRFGSPVESPLAKFIWKGSSKEISLEEKAKTEWTDKHYDFTYKLSEEEIKKGEVKLDVYKVAKVWRIGSRDDSGALWHCFKTIARFGDKNPVEREIRALYAQVKGLARENGVKLDDI